MASRRVVLAFLAAAGALLQTRCHDPPLAPPERAQAESITGASILKGIGVLADDSMRGRLTPSPDLDRAAAYAASEFERFGLRPGLASGFVQTWPIGTLPPETLALAAARPRASPRNVANAPNVVGILDGTDPSLRNEYVLLVAHMDHLGVGDPIAGDSIYNGADDNASGTAAVIELARALSGLASRPRRSMIFLLVSGEEEGLWGSTYYVAHPAVPLAQTVAALNLDMIGRNARDSVLVIGAALSSLGEASLRAARAHAELGMRPVAMGLVGGSDHVPFARAGVPVLFFFAGLHADYHRPSDAVGLIDGEKEARIARLVFYLALDIANDSARPTWIPGARPAAPARAVAR